MNNLIKQKNCVYFSYEIESYPKEVVDKEREVMTYVYHPNT